MLETLARIGIVPGKDFDPSKLSAFDQEAIKAVPKLAQVKIYEHLKEFPPINGWLFTTKTGIYGTDYLNRAFVTAIGLGANRVQDAVYPTSLKDSEGKAYDGKYRYIMHFPKGELPPAKGFWSLTMYDQNYFFVANPINRYSISARQNLATNPDGSTDLYIQHDSPGAGKESNWLPAPAGKFVLMLRMYWPSDKPPSIIDGSWTIPAVKKVA